MSIKRKLQMLGISNFDPESIDWSDTKQLVDHVWWMFFDEKSNEEGEKVKKSDFAKELKRIIEGVRAHTLRSVSVMTPEQFNAFIEKKFKQQ